ncbi:hypothetical protein STRMA_0187 [Streptococcus macacae NCTC 11558]|uniref:Uncharacterized protein n=1 Tax=Streptococcus macacae NCTC 11558 TaxID=764298 RepID=G5JYC6_9STRE|nr:hypothetical protein STRMA_0187 [Streptococcus macacae NCTC 11558]
MAVDKYFVKNFKKSCGYSWLFFILSGQAGCKDAKKDRLKK